MKIEGKRPSFDQPLDRVDATKTSQAGLGRQRGATTADQIRVSAEARLAREAVQLAQDGTDVRPEAVDRAKALLESGQLGADAEAIADKLIDSALEG